MSGKANRKGIRAKPVIESLEPRTLFSADALALFADLAATTSPVSETAFPEHATDDLIAADPGLQSRISTAAPVFLNAGPYTLIEGAAETTFVGNIDAVDGDGGGVDAGISYSIISNVNPDADGENAFAINSATGRVVVNDAGDLDFESTPTLVITVQADDGTHTTSTNVTINLSDVAPTLTVAGAANINAGKPYVLDITATEPGTSGISSYTVNWGDGTVTTEPYSGTTTSVSHVYSEIGFTHHITFAAHDTGDTWINSDLIAAKWVAGSDDVFFFDAMTGTTAGAFASTGGDLSQPYGITLGPDGTILVTGHDSDNIVRFAADGTYLGVFSAHSQLEEPTDLVWGSDGNLYVSNYGNDNILRFDADGNFIDIWGSGGSLSFPESIAFGPDGDLYVSDWDNSRIIKIDGTTGGAATTVIGGGLTNPEKILFNGDGNLFIAHSTPGEVLRWDGTSLSLYFSHPDLVYTSGLAFGPDGQLYISSHDNSKILRYDGVSAEVFIDDGAVDLMLPAYLAFTADHRVTIVDNHAPSATNRTTTSSYTEGATNVAITDISISDTDAGETISAALTLANTAAGSLSANNGATYNATTGVWTISDTVSKVNTALANLVFNPTGDNDLDTTISVAIDDADEDLSGALTGTITLDVAPVNDPPVLAAIANQSVNELTLLNFTATAADIDLPGDNLNYSLDATSIASGMTIDSTTGSFSWNPDETQGGTTHSVTVKVTDDGTGPLSDSETFTLSVTDTNVAPVLTAIGDQSIDEGNTLAFTASATDSDNPTDNLSYSLDAASIALGMGIHPSTGVFSWTPDETQGGLTPSVTVTATDDGSGSLSDNEVFTITVNDTNVAPAIGFIGNHSIDEGNTMAFNVIASDSDNPADNLSYSLDAASIALGMNLHPTTGAFIWTPNETQGGLTPTVTVTVTDDGSGALSDSEDFSITVNDTNSAPVLGFIGNQSIDEGNTLAFIATASDSDDPTDTLSFSLDAAAISLGMSIHPTTGAFSWTPTEAQGGLTPSVTLTVTDDGTGNLADSETFTVSVVDTNVAPILDPIGNHTVNELDTLTFIAPASDSDNPTDNLSFSLDAASIALGMGVHPTTGAFSWTPTETQGGLTPSVTLTVTDDGSGNLTDSETFTVSVVDTNAAPILDTIGNHTVNELDTQTFIATASDSDEPTDNLSFSLDAASIALGMSVHPTTGAFSWTPTEAQGGLIPSVTLTVTDDGTGNLADSETFTVGVVDTNVAPILDPIGNHTVNELDTLTFIATASDSDDPTDNLSFSLDAASIALGMSVDPTTGAFSWTPTETQGGLTPSVTLTVTDDGTGNLADSETFTVSVVDTNVAPLLDPIGNHTVNELDTLTFIATASDSDNPTDNLSFSLDAASIALGMGVHPTTGAFSWTPTEAQGGLTPSVTLTVTDDGTGNLADSETFTVGVVDTNVAPILDPIGNHTVNELDTLTFIATASDSDDPTDNLSFSLDAASIALGMSVHPTTGAFSWTPTETQGGLTPSVTLTVTDDGTGNLADSETFTVSVVDTNAAPILDPIGNHTVNELDTLTFIATASDSDNPTDNLSFSLEAASITLGMSVHPTTGAFSWTPSEAQGGLTSSVTLTVTDDGTGTLADSESFTISVVDTNVAPILDPIGNHTVNELDTLTFTASASDSDNPIDNLSFSLDAASIALGMSTHPTTGAFSWTPTEAQGGLTPSVTLTVTDDGTGDLTDNETFTVTVIDTNVAPILDPIGNHTVNELNTLSFTATATDSDDPTDNLSFSLDAASIALGMSINPTTGAFSWTPTEDHGGLTPASTITVTDDGTGSLVDNESINIVVNEVNAKPTLSAAAVDPVFTEDGDAVNLFTATSISTIEGGQVIESLSLTVDNITDGADERLNIDGTRIALTDGNSGTTVLNTLSFAVAVTGSSAAIELTGGTLTEEQAQTLIDTLSYQNDNADTTSLERIVTIRQLVDSGGIAHGGVDNTNLAIASTISLVPINSEPTLTTVPTDPVFTEGNSAVKLFDSTNISTIEGGQTLTSIVLRLGNITDGADELLNLDDVAIALVDGNNGVTSTNALSYSVGRDGTATVVTVAGNLTATQTQALLDSISYQNDSSDPSTTARVITIAQLQDSGGTDSGGDNTSDLNLRSTVTVVPVNDEEVLVANNGMTILEGTTDNIIDAAVLRTEDVDNSASEIVYTLMEDTVDGWLSLNGVSLIAGDNFTQNDINNTRLFFNHDGSEGTATNILFSVDDQAGTSSSGVFNINVININDSDPVADDEALLVDEGGEATEAHLIAGTTLLDGDTDPDLPFDTLSIDTIPVQAPVHGELVLNDDGTFIYTHDGSENHNDKFTYALLDANGGRVDFGEVVIHITPVNDPPTLSIAIDTEIVIAATSIELPAETFTDLDSNTLIYTATLASGEALPHWLTFDATSLTFTIEPINAVDLDIEVVLTAADEQGAKATTSLFFRSAPQLAAANSTVVSPNNQLEQTEPQPAATTADTSLEITDTAIDQSRTDSSESQEFTSEHNRLSAPSVVMALAPVELIRPAYQQVEAWGDDARPREASVEPPSSGSLELPPDAASLPLLRLFDMQDEQTDALMASLSASMDRIHNDLEEDTTRASVVVGTSTVLTSSVTVGYAFWAIRGGMLISSALASLPAWRLIDPLPVLTSLQADATEEDSESLESIVEENNVATEPQEE